MRYSQTTELGIESLLFMATQPERRDFTVVEVAEAQNVSPSYLAKTFQQLTKAGLLKSHRGAKGGYQLGKPLDEISIWDIIQVIEGSQPLFECSSEVRGCEMGARCLILQTFNRAERAMREVLESVTLAQLVEHLVRHGEPSWFESHAQVIGREGAH